MKTVVPDRCSNHHSYALRIGKWVYKGNCFNKDIIRYGVTVNIRAFQALIARARGSIPRTGVPRGSVASLFALIRIPEAGSVDMLISTFEPFVN
jgi:hypothetical protein